MVNDATGRVEHLLKKSNAFFKQRNLPQATTLAEEGLSLSNDTAFIEGKVRANLMLAKIHNVIAQYQGDQDASQKGFDFAETAVALAKSHLSDHNFTINALLVLAQSTLHQKIINKQNVLLNQLEN